MKKLLLAFVLIVSTSVQAQELDADYFRAPLDIPLYLSGNFAELRSSHFHSGLDFKTQGREGLNVYAVADGHVSRIKVSPYGYGNALYIDHPNGMTSVYAHLSQYSDSITSFLIQAQYDLESFEVDLYPDSGLLKVRKGEIIGLSGNTGSSGGPHLHFEVRETKTEFPVNPLLFNFDIKDHVKPEIINVMVIPMIEGKSLDDERKIYPCSST
ncbi:MAG: M23 family metallopeptidase, partial [Flavobacteriales bacterium]|nr:M23 family metallopeptidase [Flavobacteriales bacterium]